MSTKSEKDLLKLNPYLSKENINRILKLTIITILRSSRVGHTNRCISAAQKLQEKLKNILIMKKAERAKQKVRLLPNLLQASSDLAKMLATKRHYVRGDSDCDRPIISFDPRYLVFEFTWNIVLRKAQVNIVQDFIQSLKDGRSKVKQMIMGAGKTTVVAPLLALMLANGDDLVLSVVPRALLEMSRKRMQETFSIIVQKRIYTLNFDRSTNVKSSLTQSLENAVKNRGIVVATPTAIKRILGIC